MELQGFLSFPTRAEAGPVRVKKLRRYTRMSGFVGIIQAVAHLAEDSGNQF